MAFRSPGGHVLPGRLRVMQRRLCSVALMNGVQQIYDPSLELFRSDATLGHELRRTETEAIFLMRCGLVRGVDHQRDIAQSILSAQPLHDCKTVGARQTGIEDEKVG